jgi:mitogen-activated protein kinase 1/3
MVKDTYDPRHFIRNPPVLSPQPAVPPPSYYYQAQPIKPDYDQHNQNHSLDVSDRRLPTSYAMATNKVAPEIAIDMRAPPFHHFSSGPKDGGIAARSHQKVGMVQFGISKMY